MEWLPGTVLPAVLIVWGWVTWEWIRSTPAYRSERRREGPVR